MRNGGSGEPEVKPQARSGRNDERKGRSLEYECSLIERSERDRPDVWRSAGVCGGGMIIFRNSSAHRGKSSDGLSGGSLAGRL